MAVCSSTLPFMTNAVDFERDFTLCLHRGKRYHLKPSVKICFLNYPLLSKELKTIKWLLKGKPPKPVELKANLSRTESTLRVESQTPYFVYELMCQNQSIHVICSATYETLTVDKL